MKTQSKTLLNYSVSIWWQGENFANTFWAEDEQHATEQAENSYPGCFVSDIWLDEINN